MPKVNSIPYFEFLNFSLTLNMITLTIPTINRPEPSINRFFRLPGLSVIIGFDNIWVILVKHIIPRPVHPWLNKNIIPNTGTYIPTNKPAKKNAAPKTYIMK